jgi:hypothetical protein
VGLKLNGAHHLLVYVNDVNLLEDKIIIIKKITEPLIDDGKKVGLELNVEKTKYMLLSRHQNAGQNHDIKIANRSFENVAQSRYLGTTVSHQNFIQDEIKRRLNLNNACYHLIQNLLSSRLPSKNVKVGTYKTTILSVVLYGCET